MLNNSFMVLQWASGGAGNEMSHPALMRWSFCSPIQTTDRWFHKWTQRAGFFPRHFPLTLNRSPLKWGSVVPVHVLIVWVTETSLQNLSHRIAVSCSHCLVELCQVWHSGQLHDNNYCRKNMPLRKFSTTVLLVSDSTGFFVIYFPAHPVYLHPALLCVCALLSVFGSSLLWLVYASPLPQNYQCFPSDYRIIG